MGLLGDIRGKLRGMEIERFMRKAAQDNADFDTRYGVDTAGKVFLDAYDLSEEAKAGVEYYQVVHEGVLRTIIETVAPNPEEMDFIDIGCGKGKALLVASTYPFRRVRGVEISQKLADLANSNVAQFAKAGTQKCTDVQALCQDAREVSGFRERTLVFMLNPFHDEPMQGFVPALDRQAQEGGHGLLITYLTPHYRRWFDETRGFKTLFDTNRLVIYATPGETLPAGASEKLTRTFTSYRL